MLDEGWEVFALDDLSTGAEANIFHLREREGFHLVVDSVLSPSIVSELVHRSTSSTTWPPPSACRLIVEQPGRTLLTNVQGAENVLEYCARFEKPVLVASSSEVYGNHPEDVSLEEDAHRIYGPTTAKRWAYADTKALDEFLALALKHERGLRCVIARLFNTVGPRQNSQYGNVMPRFVQRALAGEPLEIHGDGSQTRCFCHVSDVVRALRGLLDKLADGGIYNVGSTERITIREFAERVLEATGSRSELVFVPYDDVYEGGVAEEMFHRAPAIDKITTAIGWRPTIESRRHSRGRHLVREGDSGAEPDLRDRRDRLSRDDRGRSLFRQVPRQPLVSDRLRGSGKPGLANVRTVRVAREHVDESELEQPFSGRLRGWAEPAVERCGCHLHERARFDERLDAAGRSCTSGIPLGVREQGGDAALDEARDGGVERERPTAVGELEQEIAAGLSDRQARQLPWRDRQAAPGRSRRRAAPWAGMPSTSKSARSSSTPSSITSGVVGKSGRT